MKEISIYVDESGDCKEPGAHVVAAMWMIDDWWPAVDAEKLWQSLGFDWRTFHAAEKDDESRRRAISAILKHLGTSGGRAGLVCARHVAKQSYGYEFYAPLALEAAAAAWREAVAASGIAGPAGVNCQIILEGRGNLNQRYLLGGWRENAAAIEVLGRTGVIAHPQFFNIPKGWNVFVQVADLASNAAWRRLSGNPLFVPDRAIGTEIQVSEPLLTSPGSHRLTERVLDKKAVPQARFYARERRVREQDTRADVLFTRVQELHSQGAAITAATCDKVVKSFMEDPPELRAPQIDGLLESCEEEIDVKREYQFGKRLCEVISALVEQERTRDEQSEEALDRWTIGVSSLRVLLGNHEGRCLANAPSLAAALKSVARLQAQFRYWESIAKFTNFVGVSLHNEMRFSEAFSRLEPLVNFFTGQASAGPFGGGKAGSPWIGRLLGTHSQSIAFMAHDGYFAGRDPAMLARLTDDAVCYSALSQAYFDCEDDSVRQDTYQAHAHIQAFMLTGDRASLAAAVPCLLKTPEPASAVLAFTKAFPGAVAITPAYRVAVLLKQAWLADEKPDWLADFSKWGLAKLGAIPAVHPYEQILGYLALLESGAERTRIEQRLADLKWPALVGTIARFFLAQLEFGREGAISAKTRSELASVCAVFPAGWLSGQLDRELAALATGKSTLRGPLALLPFNYS
jgi:hypothetical protein